MIFSDSPDTFHVELEDPERDVTFVKHDDIVAVVHCATYSFGVSVRKHSLHQSGSPKNSQDSVDGTVKSSSYVVTSITSGLSFGHYHENSRGKKLKLKNFLPKNSKYRTNFTISKH